ncbi:hypothetical protein E4U60_002815 [Claviceps pazoutovae]|uniref:C2H2-type domain-containing protein n=1 Tax=Claviceps pazoutovae TaxID=1649127 RepID=A0A9P7MAX6_9HYPO|nr:hypothetical protein E4U60_002815 [Claviceps pazoutovae]
MDYKQLHHDLDFSGNFLPSHEEHNQPSIPPMISDTLNEAGVINGEALENLSRAQIGNSRPFYPGNLSVATTDAAHATDHYFMFDPNGDCFDSSVNNASERYPCYDLPDTITDYGAMPFSPAGPPMQRSETNVSAASTALLKLNTEFNPLDLETREQPETETANVSNLELGDLPSNSEAASLTRRPSKGKKGSKRNPGQRYICPACMETSVTFRGDHELQRHFETKHRAHVKFVCRDPTEAGTVSKLSVIQPLYECKACTMGKIYSRHDNAVAHLRTVHFKNKSSRNGNSVEEPGGEKRGGMSGPEQDPMIDLNDLRPWVVEVRSAVNRGEDCEASNDEEF